MSTEIIAKANEILNANNDTNKGWEKTLCALALIDEDGFPTASTVSVIRADGVRQLTFSTQLDSNKAKRIRENNRAGVCINSATDFYNITLVGTIEILTDLESKTEAWYEGSEEIFSGVDDPNYCVLRFSSNRYSLYIDCESVAGTVQG